MNQMAKSIQSVINITWPMVVISTVVLVSIRLAYLIKNRKHLVLYKELLTLSFIIYILCLFQIVTFQDDVIWSSNNFIPFKEILRYDIGSKLFFKNVLGNVFLFIPFGVFTTYYLNNKKIYPTIILSIIASVAIEVVQMSIGRVFDIDDIILNMCGGIVGFYVYELYKSIYDRLPSALKKELVLNMISIIILIGIILMI